VSSARREALLVALVAAALYLVTLAANHSEAEDGLRYAVEVRGGTAAALSNSAHLAYNWLSWAVYNAARGLGYTGEPLLTMQVLNALLGGLGLGLLWMLLRRTTPGRTAALCACGLLGCSFGYWFYSAEAEVYLLAAVSLIAALTMAVRATESPSIRRFALLGVVNGVAVLCHNTNVLFAAVAVTALFLVRNEVPRPALVRCGVAYAGSAAAVVLPAYALAVWAQDLPLDQVGSWLKGLSATTQGGQWGVLGPDNVPKAFAGAGRALIGGHFASALVPQGAASDLLPAKLLREEYFMMRGWSKLSAGALLLPVGAVIAGVLLGVRGWAARPSLDRGTRVVALLCAAWLCAYVPFFVWWEPANVEFWIAPWIPASILLTVGIVAAAGERSRAVVAVLVGSLFALNLLGSLLPLHRDSDDYWRARLSWYRDNAGGGDLIVASGYIWANYLANYTSGRVLDVEEPMDRGPAAAAGAIGHEMSVRRPKRVLISSSVLYPGADRFARCSEVPGTCRAAPALRRLLLPHTRPVERGPLERIWQVLESPGQ
jgi:hypothetical protein